VAIFTLLINVVLAHASLETPLCPRRQRTKRNNKVNENKQKRTFKSHHINKETFQIHMFHMSLCVCRVTQDLMVKISDAAFSADLHPDDYWTCDGKAVPIRWMAPESLKQGFFDTKSDVVRTLDLLSLGKPLGFRENPNLGF